MKLLRKISSVFVILTVLLTECCHARRHSPKGKDEPKSVRHRPAHDPSNSSAVNVTDDAAATERAISLLSFEKRPTSHSAYTFHKSRFSPFHFLDSDTIGKWHLFKLKSNKNMGWSTRYPMVNKSECIIANLHNETSIRTSEFNERELFEDNFIFLKIKTFVDGQEVILPGSLNRFNWRSKLPSHFAIMKDESEGNFKFTPIRLHQFPVLLDLRKAVALRAENYEVSKPREMEVVFNISGACWHDVELLKYRNKYYVVNITDTIKEVIINHIILFQRNLMAELKEKFGKLWKEGQFDQVCYVENPTRMMFSVPFLLKQCCSYKKQSLLDHHNDDGLVALPVECHDPGGTFQIIRQYAIICAGLVFCLAPLLIIMIPSRMKPYEELAKCKKLKSEKQSRDDLNHHDLSTNLTCKLDKDDATRENQTLLQRSNKTASSDSALEAEMVDSLPPLLTEGVDFNLSLRNRVYLDSDPEFHLSIYLVCSCLMGFHVKNYVLILFRRAAFSFLIWLFIGVGIFFFSQYYPRLLEEPLSLFIVDRILFPICVAIYGKDVINNLYHQMSFFFVALPSIMTILYFIFFAQIVLKRNTIAKTLLQRGDLYFFGDPFPEKLVEMRNLRRTPRQSKKYSYETLLCKNMVARIGNLCKLQFWQLWWRNVVCKHHLQWLLPLWLPVAISMVLLHCVPVFSMWSNYTRRFLHGTLITDKSKNKTNNSEAKQRPIIRILLVVPLFIGIFILYVTVWMLMVIYVQFFAFLTVDVVRNAQFTLPRCILVFSIVGYIITAFHNFEDAYRSLKESVLDLCQKFHEEATASEDSDVEVILCQPPHEPIFIRTVEGEVSIPRRLFYDVTHAFLPYKRHVVSVMVRLMLTFLLVITIYLVIIEFHIMSEFSEMGETFLTICTVLLPTAFGMLQSDAHQSLSNRRREEHIVAWLHRITAVRRVDMRGKGSPRRALGESGVTLTL